MAANSNHVHCQLCRADLMVNLHEMQIRRIKTPKLNPFVCCDDRDCSTALCTRCMAHTPLFAVCRSCKGSFCPENHALQRAECANSECNFPVCNSCAAHEDALRSCGRCEKLFCPEDRRLCEACDDFYCYACTTWCGKCQMCQACCGHDEDE